MQDQVDQAVKRSLTCSRYFSLTRNVFQGRIIVFGAREQHNGPTAGQQFGLRDKGSCTCVIWGSTGLACRHPQSPTAARVASRGSLSSGKNALKGRDDPIFGRKLHKKYLRSHLLIKVKKGSCNSRSYFRSSSVLVRGVYPSALSCRPS